MGKCLLGLATLVLFVIAISALADNHVVVLTDHNFQEQVGQDRGALVWFYYATRCANCRGLAFVFDKLALKYNESKSVLIGKVDCDVEKQTCNKFGISTYPSIHLFPKGSLEPKKYHGAQRTDALLEFVNNEEGTNVMIASVPSSVVVLNPDNFDEIVLDTTKDVLVQFCISWCHYCKSLAPTYEKVAAAFNMEEDVVIATIDAGKHMDIGKKYRIRGYPTLKFFPKGNKAVGEAENYYGGRNLDELVSFINEKRGTSREGKGNLLPTAVA